MSMTSPAGSSRASLLILLLGGRIQPAAMTAFQLRPDVAACIVSKDTPKVADTMIDLLRRRFPSLQFAATQTVSATAPSAAREAVEKLLQAYSSFAPTVSLTGAPVPMTLGAYEAARTQHVPTLYLPTNQNVLLDVTGEGEPRQMELRVDLPDFLLVHSLQMLSPASYPATISARHKQAIDYFQRDFAVTTELLAWLIDKGLSHGLRQRAWPLGDAHKALMIQLAHVGVIQRLAWRHSGASSIEYQVSDAESLKFLSGGWLEQYIYLSAQIKHPEIGKLFDHKAYGLELQSNLAQTANTGSKQATREIDFIGLRQNAPLIASCKTAKKFWDKAFLDELASVGYLLGENYCTKLFVTNQPIPRGTARSERDWPKAARQFLAQAEEAKVVVVTGEELGNMKKILAREAIEPTYRRR